jgi:hypothetical protein
VTTSYSYTKYYLKPIMTIDHFFNVMYFTMKYSYIKRKKIYEKILFIWESVSVLPFWKLEVKWNRNLKNWSKTPKFKRELWISAQAWKSLCRFHGLGLLICLAGPIFTKSENQTREIFKYRWKVLFQYVQLSFNYGIWCK